MILIFTSCYNQGNYLEQAIESVLNQSYKDFKYLLIDDGSTDNTSEIIEKYSKKDNRIIPLILQKNPSLSKLINLSFCYIPYDAWLWVPADDIVEETIVEKKLNKLTPYSIIFSYGIIIDSNSIEKGRISYNWSSSKEFRERIWKECFIGMTGVMISRKTIELVGNFPEHMKFSEDYYWILKSTLFENIDYHYIPEFLYRKRIHQNRLSNKYHTEILSNIEKIKQEIRNCYQK